MQLCLINQWLHECPPAVTAVFMISRTSNIEIIQGLSKLLLVKMFSELAMATFSFLSPFFLSFFLPRLYHGYYIVLTFAADYDLFSKVPDRYPSQQCLVPNFPTSGISLIPQQNMVYLIYLFVSNAMAKIIQSAHLLCFNIILLWKFLVD